jgi:5-methylcytosine-specific restriction endonuclease McrA
MEYNKNERMSQYMKAYRKDNQVLMRVAQKRRHQRLKQKVISLLGGSCRCGEKRTDALTVDHIEEDGNEHRKGKTGYAVYRDILKTGSISGVQLLCWNCHVEKSSLSLAKQKVSKAAESIRRLKDKVISSYDCKCSLCGNENRDALTLDHIYGGGRKDRQESRLF